MTNKSYLFLCALLMVGCGGSGGGESSNDNKPAAVDTDGDGIADTQDTDDDNDGVLDVDDAFPLDKDESADFDKDGVGNNADPDDDGDGVNDVEDAFPLDATETLDTDGDGIGNNADDDDDGDGANDDEDAFPLDATETLDTDGDGIGNNADDDDDGDGINDEDDAFPLDANESIDTDGDGVGDNSDFYVTDASCYAENDGNGQQCYLTWLAQQPNSYIDGVADGVIYFADPSRSQLFEYDTQTKHFTGVIELGDSPVTAMVYAPKHERLYLAFENTSLKYVEDSTLNEYTTLAEPAFHLVETDSRLLVNYGANYQKQSVLLTQSGTVLAEAPEHNYFSRGENVTWNSQSQRLYHFRDGISPNDIMYTELDPASGSFGDSQDSPHHGDYNIYGPIILSEDGARVMLGSGDIYTASTLTYSGSVSEEPEDGFWTVQGGLITLEVKEGQTRVYHRNTSFTKDEYRTFEGGYLQSLFSSNENLIITSTETGIKINSYTPSDDTDGDGSSNLQDAFPNDPAASVDSDNDGYPDQWHDGYDQSSSVTGLMLDAFPQDSACWLAEHGSGGVCDIEQQIPNFVATQIVDDGEGTIYMLAGSTIYPWSASVNGFTNPIHLRQPMTEELMTPTQMAYSAAHERLYLGDESGAIHYVDLNDSAQIHEFASMSMGIGGLESVGNFVLAQDYSGAWATHTIFNAQGQVTASEDWNRYSRGYEWNSSNNRVYFLRDGTSPNDLHFEEIDQLTGEIVAEGETPYHSSDGIRHPIKLSFDKSKVILGSGQIYDADDLTLLGDLDVEATDILWLKDTIVTQTQLGDSHSGKLQFWSTDDYGLLGSTTFSGEPLALAKNGQDITVITQLAGRTSFTHQAIADHDLDGLPAWWEQQYGLSDADASDAALDSDNDGLTNLREFNLRLNPQVADTDSDGISDGDEVDVYKTDPLNLDSDADGLTDGEEVNTYGTDPLNSDSDADGLTDFDEINQYQTNPLNTDSDADGLPDKWEVDNQLDPNMDSSQQDTDSDGLTNLEELTYQTDPNVADTDADGLMDGDEVHAHGTSPVAYDSDQDRMSDGWEVQHQFDPNSNHDAQLDADSDSFSNLTEFLLESDPLDGQNVPIVTSWYGYQGTAAHRGFVASDIDLDAMDVRWEVSLDGTQYTKPQLLAADGKVIALFTRDDERRLLSLDALSGVELWSNNYENVWDLSIAYYGDKLYALSRASSGNFLRAISGSSGQLVYKVEHSLYSLNQESLNVTADGVYLGSSNGNAIERFDLQNGDKQSIPTASQGAMRGFAINKQQAFYSEHQDLVVTELSTGEHYNIVVDSESYNSLKTPVVGFEGDVFVYDYDKLNAIDLRTNEVKWQQESGFDRYQLAVGIGELYAIRHDSLVAIDTRTGSQLWQWESAEPEQLDSNIIVANNVLFVASAEMTYALDLTTHQQVWSYPVGGQLALSSQGALYIINADKLIAINVGGDTDQDGMPDWWESAFGLDINDNSDVSGDLDLDGLTNLEEYQHSANPTLVDSDSDTLSDGDEVHVYGTNPVLIDSDQDGLADNVELIEWLTDPNVVDTDGDGFSDGDEVNRYMTDPLDVDSVPDLLTTLFESFESEPSELVWSTPVDSDASWLRDDTQASDGNYSLRSGDIDDSQESSMSFELVNAPGTLSFDALLDSESCCDKLSVYVNDVNLLTVTTSEWSHQQINLPEGDNTIKFVYSKDGSVSSGEDAVWIDNINFNM
ncbi:PQQ-binding-like beta-propeller repeat protein [Shewanella sp. WXL01]|uniref:outer membrane protein assembly factor BamB family protein n=1 Tax=Shewanella sp. WXL01 TaxID=2709721 RepID=UPI0014385A8D|nr:PQQ-binding-like beta-propeller repeat protein [Shewanella sp. WXL01]NKF49228.1 PQQ-binding-like beta-propeller repeat protein [Shewanella sp. WXL01]